MRSLAFVLSFLLVHYSGADATDVLQRFFKLFDRTSHTQCTLVENQSFNSIVEYLGLLKTINKFCKTALSRSTTPAGMLLKRFDNYDHHNAARAS